MNLRDTQRARANKREGIIAKSLGVTPVGLAVLARMVAGGGTGRAAGMAGQRLLKQGYITDWYRDEWGLFHEREITDAGREIVRKARALGW